MEYRLAKMDDAKKIYEIVQDTIKRIYPKYYLPQIVDMFSRYHNLETISNDIENENSYVLLEDGKIIGTGTKVENHISRVYVLPEFQGKGYGTYIMNQLENEIANKYETVELDASLSACKLYYRLGYRTVEHGIWECADGVIQVYEIMEKNLAKDIVTCNALRLRPYKAEDAMAITSWIHNEEEQRRWSADIYKSYPVTLEDINEKYCMENGACLQSDDFFPVTAIDGNKIIGHLILRYLDENKETLRFGFVIVDDKIRGRGYGKKMLQLAIQYAFETLKATRITLGVFENNPEAYHCYKSVGFQKTDEDVYYQCMGEQWKCIEMEIREEKR